MRKMRTPGENFIVGFIWRWVTNWLTSWEHSCITHAAGKTGWMMKTSYENQKNQHDKNRTGAFFFTRLHWMIVSNYFEVVLPEDDLLYLPKVSEYLPFGPSCETSVATNRRWGPCLDPTVQWRNRRPVALGPQVSFHSAQPTNDEMYPLDDGFLWGKLSTWFASKILGEGLLKTAPLPPCWVPRNQSAGTYFCCWLKLDQVLRLQFLKNLLRPLSDLRVFGILSYSLFSFAFTQKLSSSSSASVAVIASRRCGCRFTTHYLVLLDAACLVAFGHLRMIPYTAWR